MSTTIDQQVVEMRFDNKHFEQNVSTTMSTLDKFKQKLNMTDAAKGLENVNVAAKKVDLSSISNSAETVGLKFNALYTIADQAFRNITNSAYNAGKNIVKSLTIDPITTGFNEYELKMGSIQTIMAGTGESLDTVNRYLNELNEYSDKTIYSFKDMTSNIGKFTNAGVSLEDAVLAIKGISNEAALSGANTNEASRAMYNFSQALSAGYVKLIDWKSIELANMATKDFKQQLIDTATEVGTLEKAADGMYNVVNVVSNANATSLNATKNFNDSLGNQWMTTEVLIETLRKYADETTDVGKRATAAATEVKTFTMMMDTLKEAAQSGWAQTWELFVGDFEEAKAFFTELSDIFGGIIGDSANRRNAFFGEALTSNWDKLIDKLETAGITAEDFEEEIRKQSGTETYIDSLIEKYGSLEDAIRDGAVATEIIQRAFDSIADSKLGKTVDGFVEGLKEIKRLLKYDSVGDDVKKLQTALDTLGYDLGAPGIDGIIGPITEAAIKAFQKDHNLEIDGIVGPETLAALEEAGTKVNELEGDVDDLKSSCKSLINVITQKSGRELLLGSLLNIISAIRKPLSAVGKALGKVFNFKPTQLYNLIENFNKFTNLLIINDATAAKLQRTFEGLFSAFKIVTTIAGGAMGIAFKALMVILEKFDIGFLDLTANIGDALVSISTFISDGINKGLGAAIDWLLPKITKLIETLKGWVKSLKETKIGKEIIGIFENWPKTLEKISGALTSCAEAIKGWITELRNTQLYKDVTSWFGSIGDAVAAGLGKIKDAISNLDMSAFSDRITGIRDFFTGIIDTLKESELVMSIVDNVKAAFENVKKFFSAFKFNFTAPEFNLENIKLFSGMLERYDGVDSIGGFFKTFASWFKGSIITKAKTGFKNLTSMDWNTFKYTAMAKFADFWIKVGDKVKKCFEKCKEIFQAISEFVFGTSKVDLPTILNLAEKFLAIYVLIQALKAIQTVFSPLDNISDALNNIATSIKWSAVSSALKAMALALGAVTLCIIILASMPDMNRAWEATKILGAVLLGMAAIIGGLMFMAAKMPQGDVIDIVGVAGSLLILVGTVYLLTEVLKRIDEMQIENPMGTFIALFLMLLGLAAGIKIVAAAGKSSFKSVAAILTLVGALNLILNVITAYSEYDWSGKRNGIIQMGKMLILLAVTINLASRGVKEGASASGLAFAILAMVVSLKLILSAIKDFAATPDEVLEKGGRAVAKILALMAILMGVANLTNKGVKLEKGQKAVNNFTGFAVALLAVVGAIWLLGKLALNDEAVLIKGGNAVGMILLAFTTTFGIIGKACSGLKMGSIWSMIAGIVIVIAALGTAIYLLRDIPWQTSLGVAGAMSLIILAMGMALKTLVKYDVYSGNIWHWVLAMGALALIVIALGRVLEVCKDVSWQSALGVAGGIGIILAAMALSLLTLSKYEVSSGNIWKWIPAMGAMTIVVGLLAFVLKSANGVAGGNSVGVATGLAITLGAVALVLGLLSKIPVDAKSIWKWVPAMAAMSVVAGLLAFVLYNMDGMDAGKAVGNAAALSILLVTLTGTMAVLMALSKFANPTGILAGVVGIAMLGLVVWELGEILNKMRDYNLGDMMDDVAVLSVMLVVLTGVMAALTGLGTILSGGGTFLPAAGAAAALVGIGLLGLIIWELGAILHAMKSYGLGDMMPDVLVLSALLIVLTGVMAALSVFGMLSAGAFAGIVGIAALGLVVWELGAILHAMKSYGLGDMMPDVLVLSTLLIVLTGVLATLAIIGILGVPALVGVVGLAALGLVLWELGAIINAMKSYDLGSAMPMVATLLLLIEGLTMILVQLAVVGPMAAIGVIALQGLLIVIAELAGFVGAVGFLMDKIPSLENFLDKGIGVFVKLAGGLGQIIGAFVQGAVGGLVDSLVELATGLSDFATNITGFVEAMADIDPSIGTGVTTLCDAIMTITAANMLEAITSIFGGKDLGAFGQSVADFAVCIKDAAASLSDITDDDVKNIERAAEAGLALADLNGAIPAQGGWVDAILGSQELGQFGESVVAFGKCLVDYSATVSGGKIDKDAIVASTEAGTALADLNGAIPEQGGWADAIMGSQDLGVFGQSIVTFADYLVQYSGIVSQGNLDTDAITKSAEAGLALADLNGAIPEQGGWAAAIMGEQDLALFGTQLVTFGQGLADYASIAATITDDKIAAITNSGKAVDEIKTVMEKVPEKANWWDNLWGNNQDGGSFGEAITSVANGINRFCAVAVEIADKTGSISNVGTAIDNVKTALEKVPDDVTLAKAGVLNTAVTDLKTVACTINALTAAEYDYSGLNTFRTAVVYIKNMFAGVDLDSLVEKYTKLYSASTYVSKIGKEMAKVNDYTYEGIDRFRTMLKDLGGTDVDAVISAFQGKSDDVKTAVGGFIKAMSTAIDNNANQVTLRMEALMNSAVKSAKDKTDEFGPIGTEMAKKLGKGIEGGQSSVYTAGENAAANGASGAKQAYTSMYNAGAYLAAGFAQGISDNDSAAITAAVSMALAAVSAARAILRINSPSKVFCEIGSSIPEGFAMGIDQMGWMVKDSTEAMGNLANKSLSSTISRISDAISTDIDAQPTIRPVLDLSDVQAGAGAIGNLLGGDATVGVLSNVSGISSMMNRRSQNGSNADVVSAIDKLNRKMDNLGNTTYHIDGITYDDGSNIASAVKEIARAAKMGRRV